MLFWMHAVLCHNKEGRKEFYSERSVCLLLCTPQFHPFFILAVATANVAEY